MSFTKRRVLQMWEQEKKRLWYLLPLQDSYIDCLTLGYQMIGRMRSTCEDHPDQEPQFTDLLRWIKANEWDEMAGDFEDLMKQAKKYNKAYRG
jgi:hypothetical protein